MRHVVLAFVLSGWAAMTVSASEVLPQPSVLEEVTSPREHAVREMVRELVMRDVRLSYSLLLDELDLPSRQKEALLSFLMEDQIAGTTTGCRRGVVTDESERAGRIADIIGGSKCQQFLGLERYIFIYGEAQRIGALLERKGVPITSTQREKLLEVLVDAQRESKRLAASEAERGSIGHLEDRLLQKDEFERHVLVQAPNVLSPEQVGFLSEQYNYLSYERAHALHLQQREERADPTSKDKPLWYPTWSTWSSQP